MKRKIWKFETQVVALSGGLTALLLVFLFLIKGIAPFGTKSFVSMDANIQYLDFFRILKMFFRGKILLCIHLEKPLEDLTWLCLVIIWHRHLICCLLFLIICNSTHFLIL